MTDATARKPRKVKCSGECGGLVYSRLPDGVARCQPCRRLSWPDDGARPAKCGFCDEPFESIRRKGGMWIRACSKSCATKLMHKARGHAVIPDVEARRAAWRRKNWSKRARLRSVPSEPYTLEEIAERDGHRCGLCQRKVRLDVRAPKPGSPSIDHIIPLSKGGDDTRANVQLAHRGCNVKKGARETTVQMRLVG